MRSCTAERIMPSPIALLSLYAVAWSLQLAPTEAKHEEPYELPDAFEIIDAFPVAIAIYDEDLDGDLDCVVAVRTYFDKEAKKATYVWILQSGANITYHMKPGATPAKSDYYLNDSDGPLKTIDFFYSDYKDCVIFDIPYKGTEQCMLWVSAQVKESMPQRCKEEYKDICGYGVRAYDKDTCSAIWKDTEI